MINYPLQIKRINGRPHGARFHLGRTDETQAQKFRSSLFKGLQSPETESLVAVRRRRNTPDTIPPQGVNSKTVQWTVFEEGTPWERGRPLAVFLNELFFLP